METFVSKKVFGPYLSNKRHKISSAKSAIPLQREHRDKREKKRSIFSRIHGKGSIQWIDKLERSANNLKSTRKEKFNNANAFIKKIGKKLRLQRESSK